MSERVEAGLLCARHLGMKVTVRTDSVTVSGDLKKIEHEKRWSDKGQVVNLQVESTSGSMWPKVSPIHQVEVHDA